MSIKTLVVGAVVGLGMLAAPAAFAQAPSAAILDSYVGTTNADGVDDFATYGVSARVSKMIVGAFGLQGDVSYDDSNLDKTDPTITVGGHAYFRDEDKGLIGGFVGIAQNDGDDAYVGGVEGQLYGINSTVYGQAFYGSTDDGLGDADFYGVRGEYRYFLADNTRVDLTALATKVDADGGDANVYGLGAAIEHRYETLPISAFAGYNWDRTDADGFDESDAHTFKIGVRWHFGADSLKVQDRAGVTLNNIASILAVTAGAGVSSSSYESPVIEEIGPV